MVERNLAKVEVASSSLVSRSSFDSSARRFCAVGSFFVFGDGLGPFRAGIAQLVERNLPKVDVASSNLVSRSTTCLCPADSVRARAAVPILDFAALRE